MTCSSGSSDDSCGDAECTCNALNEARHWHSKHRRERTRTLILNRSLRRSRRHRKPRSMRVLQIRLPCRSFKQHVAKEASEHQVEDLDRDSCRGGGSRRVENPGRDGEALEEQQHPADTALNGAAEKQQEVQQTVQQFQAAEEAAGYAAESRPRFAHDAKGARSSAGKSDPDMRDRQPDAVRH